MGGRGVCILNSKGFQEIALMSSCTCKQSRSPWLQAPGPGSAGLSCLEAWGSGHTASEPQRPHCHMEVLSVPTLPARPAQVTPVSSCNIYCSIIVVWPHFRHF